MWDLIVSVPDHRLSFYSTVRSGKITLANLHVVSIGSTSDLER